MKVGRSPIEHNLPFCALIRFYWLDPQYGGNNYRVLLQGEGQKAEQKHTAKTFVEFHNLSLLVITKVFC